MFDDVERRAPTVDAAVKRSTGEVDDEKSKKSLSEIYEEAYLREKERQAADASVSSTTGAAAQEAADASRASTAPPADPDVRRVEGLLKSLFQRLDELTNFHYTPPEAIQDIQVIANVPAIVVEEKVPTAISDAARLAPEEVYRKPMVVAAVWSHALRARWRFPCPDRRLVSRGERGRTRATLLGRGGGSYTGRF